MSSPIAGPKIAEQGPRDPFEHVGRRLLLLAVLGAAVCLLLAAYSDLAPLTHALRDFAWRRFPAVVALSLFSVALRFVRWHLYLLRSGASLSVRDSLATYLAGWPLGVTPGRAGELAKGWLVRELGGGRARLGVTTVLAERLVEALAVAAIILVLSLLVPLGPWLPAIAASGLICGATFLASERFARALIGTLAHIPRFRHRAEVAQDALSAVRSLLAPWPLTWGLLIAVVSWCAEAGVYVLIVHSYQPDMAVAKAALVYGVSTVLGGLSMIPAGLIVTEGAMTAAVSHFGLSRATASSSTLIDRLATLWLLVILGLLSAPWLARRIRAGAGSDPSSPSTDSA